MSMSPSLFPLHAQQLNFSVRQQTLIDRVSFRLGGHGCTAILGPNGSGKTLLLRLCHGLLPVSSGQLRWGAHSPAQAQALGQQAMVFQLPAILNRSVRANIDYALRVRGVKRNARRVRTEEVIEQCGLAEVRDRNARILSGGERQKLAIARAWVTRPQVLLMDEPTSELDPLAAHEIESMVRLIVAQGVRVLMTTHDMNQARHLADDVLFLEHGRLRAHLPVDEFFAQTGSDILGRFAGHLSRFSN